MRQNSVKQLESALNLLLPRFNDEYFVRADISVQQGKLQQQYTLTPGHGSFRLAQAGRVEQVHQADLVARLAALAQAGDELDLRLIRRNETVLVTASDRGPTVKMAKPLGNLPEEVERPLDDAAAAHLLQVLGFTDSKGALRPGEMRKYNQINQYLKAATPVLRHLASLNRPFTVIDAACGKSPLSHVLNFYLTQVLRCRVHVIGIDISPGVIATAERMRNELGYRNAEYHVATVGEFDYQLPYPAGLVVSLHACDTATDEALAVGARLESTAIIAVPCCQHELLDQMRLADEDDPLSAAMRFGLLKARLADLLTDTMRCLALQANYYNVSVQEFCSPLDTPKNLMIKAIRTGDASAAEQARRAYAALRAQFNLHPAVLSRML